MDKKQYLSWDDMFARVWGRDVRSIIDGRRAGFLWSERNRLPGVVSVGFLYRIVDGGTFERWCVIARRAWVQLQLTGGPNVLATSGSPSSRAVLAERLSIMISDAWTEES